MDFLNNSLNKSGQSAAPNQQQQQPSGGGGFMDKLNNMGGGGQAGERNEDALDKGVDFVQEKFMGQGPQNNESAFEQAKDKQIADAIRQGYQKSTGG
ncbi:hypothetical protein EST38_g8366 [Candolleomyces aberdarensis]|uniref:DNA damage-responsive protein 48 n=1 Tax=Candolleomyces aberdarensis TaxID=2316362 RepID=A0A4Q2DEU1_9AGAR|nr:hypothetical protein EST38_g8366 [Candolleomyces aberdarensis]